jgi:hypothetical protein
MNMDQNRMNRKLFAWADDVSLKSKRVKNWNYVDRKQFMTAALGVYLPTPRKKRQARD